MLEIEEVNQLSEKRKLHSIGVMKMCEKLAERYGEDPKRAMAVGLAHDMAKEMPEEEKMKYVKENEIQASELEYNNVDILHGEIAADICKKKYGFDEEMCSAIANHTMGKPEITMLEKILFIADKIDAVFTFSGGGDNDRCMAQLSKTLKNIKNEVALADRNSEMAKNNHDKLEKFIMDIK